MKQKEQKKRHRVRNALLIILVLLLLIVGIVAFVFRDYLAQIPRLYKGMSYSSDEISSMQADNDKKANELLNNLAVETMRDLTDEERQLLASGELSESDAISLIQGLMPPIDFSEVTTDEIDETDVPDETSAADTSVDTSATKPAVTTAQTTTKGKDTHEALTPERAAELQNRVSEIIAEIYLLRATYLNKIETLIADTKAEYIALPKDQHNMKGKMRIIEKSLVPKGNALEAECDTSMNKLLTELEGVLNELGTGTAIIDEIKATYQEQKDLKMAELYNQYASKLN